MMRNFSTPLLIGLAATLPLFGCDRTDKDKTPDPAANEVARADEPKPAMSDKDAEEKEEERSEKTVEAIKEGELAVGSAVNVTGELESKVSSKAFKLEALHELWGDEVLVLTKDDIAIEEGTKVKVDGTVQKLVVADVERELGWDLEPKIEAEFTAKNVVVAKSVTAVPEEGGAAH